MKKFLPKTTTALSSSIILAALLASPIAKAADYTYNPSVDLSGKFSKNRKLAEFSYMHPLLQSGDTLPIVDLKLKTDNDKSKEINLGLVLRHNYTDSAILGVYAHFDHRRTNTKFNVSGLTAGVEALSKYLDARANIYVPQNKKKKIASAINTIEWKGRSIYAMIGDDKYESALKGYDIELGTPIFAFSDILNEKIGTKVHVARYSFKGQNTKNIKGTRVRLEQDITTLWSGDNSYKFYMNAETQKDAVRKRQNFVGIGAKLTFNDKENIGKKTPNSLGHRMMETTIRDVDIVTGSNDATAIMKDLYKGGQKITQQVFAGSFAPESNHEGDGSLENPFSFEEAKKLTKETLIVPVDTGHDLTDAEVKQIITTPEIYSHYNQALETEGGSDVFNIEHKDDGAVSIANANKKGESKNILDAGKNDSINSNLNFYVNSLVVKGANRFLNKLKHSSLAKARKMVDVLDRATENGSDNVTEISNNLKRLYKLGGIKSEDIQDKIEQTRKENNPTKATNHDISSPEQQTMSMPKIDTTKQQTMSMPKIDLTEQLRLDKLFTKETTKELNAHDAGINKLQAARAEEAKPKSIMSGMIARTTKIFGKKTETEAVAEESTPKQSAMSSMISGTKKVFGKTTEERASQLKEREEALEIAKKQYEEDASNLETYKTDNQDSIDKKALQTLEKKKNASLNKMKTAEGKAQKSIKAVNDLEAKKKSVQESVKAKIETAIEQDSTEAMAEESEVSKPETNKKVPSRTASFKKDIAKRLPSFSFSSKKQTDLVETKEEETN